MINIKNFIIKYYTSLVKLLWAFIIFSLIVLVSNLLLSKLVLVIFPSTLFVVVLLSKLNFTWFKLLVVFPLITVFSNFYSKFTSNRKFINICNFLRNRDLIRDKLLYAKRLKRGELFHILNIFFTKNWLKLFFYLDDFTLSIFIVEFIRILLLFPKIGLPIAPLQGSDTSYSNLSA